PLNGPVAAVIDVPAEVLEKLQVTKYVLNELLLARKQPQRGPARLQRYPQVMGVGGSFQEGVGIMDKRKVNVRNERLPEAVDEVIALLLKRIQQILEFAVKSGGIQNVEVNE